MPIAKKIASNIINNAKRVEKIRSCKGKRAQAEKYVIGEAANMKIKLTEEEIMYATVSVIEML